MVTPKEYQCLNVKHVIILLQEQKSLFIRYRVGVVYECMYSANFIFSNLLLNTFRIRTRFLRSNLLHLYKLGKKSANVRGKYVAFRTYCDTIFLMTRSAHVTLVEVCNCLCVLSANKRYPLSSQSRGAEIISSRVGHKIARVTGNLIAYC